MKVRYISELNKLIIQFNNTVQRTHVTHEILFPVFFACPALTKIFWKNIKNYYYFWADMPSVLFAVLIGSN